MHKILRISFAIVFLGWGQQAVSAPYSWIAYTGTSSYFGSTISEACTKAAADFQNAPGVPSTTKHTFTSTYYQSNNVWTCVIRKDYVNPSGPGSQDIKVSAYRSGDSCANPDDTFNQQTGYCDPPPQDCSNLSPGIFKSPSGPIINSGGRNYIATGFPPGSSVCFGGCSYSIGSAASSCYKDVGSGTSGYCNYVGTGTGDTCTEPDAALGAPGDALNPPDTPDVPPSDPNDPCHGLPGYSWSGTTCVKDPDNTNPGGDTGGDTGGGDTGGNDGGGSTGGGNSGGGDTGGGNNGGGDSSGNGDGNGSGDGGGSSGGSGNGSGNGEGDDEEEGGSGPGFCDGDDCGFVAPSYFGGAEKIPGFDESFKRVYDGVLNSPIGSAVTGIAFPSGGGVCPSGSVELFGKNIVFDGHCTLWPQISGIFTALMIAVWSLLAVRIVLSS